MDPAPPLTALGLAAHHPIEADRSDATCARPGQPNADTSHPTITNAPSAPKNQ